MDTKLRMLYLIIVLVGALNWGGVAFDFNLVEKILGPKYSKIVYALVAISAILLIVFSSRDTFLPFLGKSAVPCCVMNKTITFDPSDESMVQVEAKVRPNCKVIYWSTSNEAAVVDSPQSAYQDYENSGTAMSDSEGNVTFTLKNAPTSYKTGFKTQAPHVHYRECEGGMLGEVQTVMVADSPSEHMA